MGLFTPIYMKPGLNGKQQSKALEKVSAITDPDKLCRIAMVAPMPSVGEKAVEGLKDDNMLRRVAWEAQSLSVRGAAVEKMMDPEVLVSLASGEPRLFEVCLGRMKALGDKQGLAKLFIEYSTPDETQSINAIAQEYRRIVGMLKHVEDQEVFRAVAKDARKTDIRIGAVELLDSPAVLSEIVNQDRDSKVRQAAMNNLHFGDIEAVSKIANDEQLGLNSLRWTAAFRLSDLAPGRAVEPLVALLQRTGGSQESKELLRKAAGFLEARYKKTANAQERERIATLRNGKYGYSWDGPCWHEDASIHFDIPR